MRTRKSECGSSIIFLDVETTGFSPQTCDIIEIGAWLFEDGVVTEQFQRRIKPEKYVPIEVQRLTGITNEMLEGCETIDHVLPEFCDFCDGADIGGYNVDFDYRFLSYKARLLGFDFTMNGLRRGIDVLKCVKTTFPGLADYKLGHVAQYLGIPTEVDKLHTAGYDAYITKLVYDRCKQVLPEMLDKTKYGKPIITDTLDFE